MGLGAKKFMGSLISSPSTIPFLVNYTPFFTILTLVAYRYMLCEELFSFLIICKNLGKSKWILSSRLRREAVAEEKQCLHNK